MSLALPLAGACFGDADTMSAPEPMNPGEPGDETPGPGDETPEPVGQASSPGIRAPLAIILFPPAESLSDAQTITVRGVAADIHGVAAIRVNGVAATTSNGFATWQAVVPLQDGDNPIVVESEDTRGHVDPAAATALVRVSRNRLNNPAAVGWDPVGERIVVADNGLAALVGVDPSTGARTILSDAGTGAGTPLSYMTSLAWDPVRGRMLVGDWGQHAVVSVDLATGDRTTIASESVGTGPVIATPFAVTWDPVNQRALVVDSAVDALVSVDLDTGARAVVSDANAGTGQPLLGVQDAAWDAQAARLLILDAALPGLLAVDPLTGNRTVLSDAATGTGPSFIRPFALALDPANGQAIVGDLDADALFVVDLATGDRSILSNRDTGAGQVLIQPSALVWDPLHGRVVTLDAGYDSLLAVDRTSGDRSVLSGFSRGAGAPLGEPDRMARDARGKRAFVWSETDDDDVLYTVDLRTGDRTLLSGNGAGIGPSLSLPDSMIWDDARQRVLVVDMGRGALMAVDASTGNRTILADGSTSTLTTFQSVQASFLDPMNPWDPSDDRLVMLDRVAKTLLALELSTGAETLLSGSAMGLGPYMQAPICATWDPLQRRAFVFDRNNATVLAVDLATGDRNVVVRLEQEEDFAGLADFELGDTSILAWDGIHGRLILGGEDYPQLPAVDLATGAITVLSDGEAGGGPEFNDPYGISYEPLRDLVYAVDGGRQEALLAIDAITGDRVILSR